MTRDQAGRPALPAGERPVADPAGDGEAPDAARLAAGPEPTRHAAPPGTLLDVALNVLCDQCVGLIASSLLE